MGLSIAKNIFTAKQDALDLLAKLQRAAVNAIFNSGGLAIGTASKKKVKLVNTVYGYIDGKFTSKTTAEITLAGTVANTKFNVFALTLKNDGTLAARMGTAGATLGAVVAPTIPNDECLIGYLLVNPTGTGDFVGGTTDLDDATVVPNAVYMNVVFGHNPNAVSL